jgi:predicted nucleotidyltransferase
MVDPSADPVLRQFRDALYQRYGGQIERVILFGSRARGDHQPDSDYDVAVFLQRPRRFWDDLGGLADITTDILVRTGAVISAKPFPSGAWQERTPLMGELRRDGVDL